MAISALLRRRRHYLKSKSANVFPPVEQTQCLLYYSSEGERQSARHVAAEAAVLRSVGPPFPFFFFCRGKPNYKRKMLCLSDNYNVGFEK